jgi:hypothetical protein
LLLDARITLTVWLPDHALDIRKTHQLSPWKVALHLNPRLKCVLTTKIPRFDGSFNARQITDKQAGK